jgi:hypothetical protein
MDSVGTLIFRFAMELAKHAGNGFSYVDVPTYKERIAECHKCPNFDADSGRCRLCGCLMETKTKWETSSCPDVPPKWSRKDGERKEGGDPVIGD